MRVGLTTDGLAHLSRRDALEWCATRGILDVEMCVGPWSPRTHLDLPTLLAERRERDRLLGELSEHGISLAAINCSGNPLHPDPARRAEAAAAVRGAVELASTLSVDRVVAMSGCPGSRHGGGIGIFAIWSMVLDDEPLWQWQFDNEVAPYWQEISSWCATIAPGLTICLELHPGAAIFNPATFERLAGAVGDNIAVNLDPSHFWWQGMDPAAVVEQLGPSIGFAHGKDTTIHAERASVNGVLDHRFPVDPAVNVWHFSAVGAGHSTDEWSRLLSAIRMSGYDDVISIEQEDPTQPPEASIEQSLASLGEALAATRSGD